MLRHACGFAVANDGHDTRSLQAEGRLADAVLVEHAAVEHFNRNCVRWKSDAGPPDATRRRRAAVIGHAIERY
jgi:hypothetical protein